MYEKLGRQAKHDLEYNGIVGIVDVPYSVMTPNPTKQAFDDLGEYEKLKKALADYLDQYVRDMRIELNKDNLLEFWRDFGYLEDDCDIPSNETRYIRKRFFKIQTIMQCDLCLKWRQWPAAEVDMQKHFPDNWCCEELPTIKYFNRLPEDLLY